MRDFLWTDSDAGTSWRALETPGQVGDPDAVCSARRSPPGANLIPERGFRSPELRGAGPRGGDFRGTDPRRIRQSATQGACAWPRDPGGLWDFSPPVSQLSYGDDPAPST